MLHEGRRYPPKAVVGVAAELVTGERFGPSDFSGGVDSACFRVLERNGFQIAPKADEGVQGRSYWWVNQNQTYREEVEGGYLWSPKRSKGGRRNPFYETMREVRAGDLVFSFADTLIRAVGIAQAPAVLNRPGIVGDSNP